MLSLKKCGDSLIEKTSQGHFWAWNLSIGVRQQGRTGCSNEAGRDVTGPGRKPKTRWLLRSVDILPKVHCTDKIWRQEGQGHSKEGKDSILLRMSGVKKKCLKFLVPDGLWVWEARLCPTNRRSEFEVSWDWCMNQQILVPSDQFKSSLCHTLHVSSRVTQLFE